MALWQIDFFITPKESLESYPFKNDEDLFDDTLFWEKRNVDKGFFTPISFFCRKASRGLRPHHFWP